MNDFETVEGSALDPVYLTQKEGVARMRASLLAFGDSPSLAKQSLNNITVLRVYHQVARIIRYLEMMDKIEDKLYRSIDNALDNMNESSNATWMLLLDMQERLQKIMIESHRLLQPYLTLQDYSVMDMVTAADTADRPKALVLDADARERLRNKAQAVLLQLEEPQEYSDDNG